MNTILEIIKFTLPSVIVLSAAYLILKTYIDGQYKETYLTEKFKLQKDTIQQKLQAYERLILFLERINPMTLIPMVRLPQMSALDLQHKLLQQIRAEYEHNIVQQLYVGDNSWRMIQATKEHVITIINNAASQLHNDASGVDLSKRIFEIIANLGIENPTQPAIQILKDELRQLI